LTVTLTPAGAIWLGRWLIDLMRHHYTLVTRENYLDLANMAHE
jgi:hypothetical protein